MRKTNILNFIHYTEKIIQSAHLLILQVCTEPMLYAKEYYGWGINLLALTRLASHRG